MLYQIENPLSVERLLFKGTYLTDYLAAEVLSERKMVMELNKRQTLPQELLKMIKEALYRSRLVSLDKLILSMLKERTYSLVPENLKIILLVQL